MLNSSELAASVLHETISSLRRLSSHGDRARVLAALIVFFDAEVATSDIVTAARIGAEKRKRS